ncbi:DUF3231 family protein [Bacillales bacterium AN1005]
MLTRRDISFSTSTIGTVTTSTSTPFSDKLMIRCIYILNGFGLIDAGTGTFFIMRNDFTAKSILLAKDCILLRCYVVKQHTKVALAPSANSKL